MTLTVMCGIPNSGKTTNTNRLADETGATVFRLDDYMRGVKTYSDLVQILGTVLDNIKIELLSGKDVIYDAVNPDAASRKQIIDYFSDMDNLEIVCAYVDTSAEICIARDKSGWSAVFAERFEPPTDEEGFGRIDVYHNEDAES